MTTLFTVLSPAPGVDRDGFHDHWRHPHGTLGARLDAVRTYVQNHRIGPPGMPVTDDPAEGVVRVELHEGATAAGIAEDPLYRVHLSADESRFIDLDAIRAYVTETLSIGPVAGPVVPSYTDGTPAGASGTDQTDVLADRLWSPDSAPTAITLLRFVSDRPLDGERRAGEVGALWHSLYQVTGDPTEDDDTRYIEQFWWPSSKKWSEFSSGDAWTELTRSTSGARVILASCERVL